MRLRYLHSLVYGFLDDADVLVYKIKLILAWAKEQNAENGIGVFHAWRLVSDTGSTVLKIGRTSLRPHGLAVQCARYS